MADTKQLEAQLAEMFAVNKTLTEQNLALASELRFRAQPLIGEMTDSLNAMTLAADKHPQAKATVAKFIEAIDEARAAAEGIDIVRKPHILTRHG